jgi:hypothetical protein
MLLWSNGTKANFRIIDDIFTPNFAPAGQYDKRRKVSKTYFMLPRSAK